MKSTYHILTILLLLLGTTARAQQTPAPPQQETISITGATLHLGDGTVVENGTLVFSDGTITAMGAGVTPEGRIIDASGKHVYPGIIAPVKSLGLVEIDAVRPSDDEDEIGTMIPHVRSLIAYNAESKVVESMRPNGVLLGQATPQGGTISGTSSIVQFDAWNWEDAAVKTDDGIHLHWPNSFRRGRWWLGEPRGMRPNKDYPDEQAAILDFIRSAKAYGKGANADMNPAYAAMQGLFSGSQRLYVYAEGEREIVDAVTALKEAGIAHVVLVGGYQAYKVTGLLKEHNIPVLVNEPHALPSMADDAYDLPYRLPKMLADAGLLVGIQNQGMSNFQTRNLPFYAGHVAGQGMDREKALQLITGNTAKILGIDDRYGTLAQGKSATLFISEGDALDMRTNQLSHAFIDGREISLETHQTELWKRYTGKYARQ
ncbi:amidohydrolase family protein [Robiginitalea sp. M366]|uniref:amidohydrolase family protein n=1 Tax=Robiginitalea aestuariiviva TaxID=3036903 RepID=UPI00240E6C6C|nr:amidohydrolase family protein [Robiginitalea aestuariiviva]MDG1573232.1 amidohydrolase family protein [Robiginitalea aestuariiviva]